MENWVYFTTWPRPLSKAHTYNLQSINIVAKKNRSGNARLEYYTEYLDRLLTSNTHVEDDKLKSTATCKQLSISKFACFRVTWFGFNWWTATSDASRVTFMLSKRSWGDWNEENAESRVKWLIKVIFLANLLTFLTRCFSKNDIA